MTTRNTDVNLIIRARTEGEKALANLSSILEGLLGEARGGKTDLAELARSVGQLDKAFASVSDKADKAQAAFTRQQQGLAGNRAELASVTAQMQGAARAAESLRAAIVERVLAGGNQSDLIAQLKLVATEQNNLEKRAGTLTAAIERQQGALEGTHSSLQQIGSTLVTLEQAQAAAAQRIGEANAALSRQSEASAGVEAVTASLIAQANAAKEAARETAAAQNFYNAKAAPALVRGGAAANGASTGALIAQFQQLAANAQQVRDALDPLSAAVRDYEAKVAEATRLAQDGHLGADELAAWERELTAALKDTLAQIGYVTAAEQDRVRKSVGVREDLTRAERAYANVLAERANIQAAIEQHTGLGALSAADQGATTEALRSQVAEEERLAVAVQQLREQLDPMAAMTARQNAELETYRKAVAAGVLSTNELAAAEAHLGEQARQAQAHLERVGATSTRGASGEPSLFGLKPYELQNLSYQINDVVTGLASGQHATQVLAQQGGQILQIFPRAGKVLLEALTNPAIAATVVTVGTLALGFKRAADEAERLRNYTALTTFRTTGRDYDPQALEAEERSLRASGAKSSDAKAAIRALVESDVDPSKLNEFADAAENAANALGIDFATAVKQVAVISHGSYDAIAKLDDQMGFLTATEREHIAELFNSGKAELARQEALNAYKRQAEDAAAKQRGPWSDAAHALGRAWDSLLGYIANSLPIRATIKVLNTLAGVVSGLGNAIADALGDDTPKSGSTAIADRIAAVQAQIKELEDTSRRYRKALDGDNGGSPQVTAMAQRMADYADSKIAELRGQLAELEKQAPGGDGAEDPNGAKAKHRTERLAELSIEEQLDALRRDADKGMSKADAARRASLAGELAYRNEIKSTGDAIIAQRLKEKAIADEQKAIDKQIAQARKNELGRFVQGVVGAEGGPSRNGMGSSASGYGQFMPATFVSYYRRTAGADQSLSDAQIVALRGNQKVAEGVIATAARDYAKAVEAAGKQVTAGNLYLMHFLGVGAGSAVLRSGDGTPVDQVIRRVQPRTAASVFAQNPTYLRADNGKGRFRTSGELVRFLDSRIPGGDGDIAASSTNALMEEQARIADANLRRQNQLNDALAEEADQRKQTTKDAQATLGLTGTALLAEQRRQAIEQERVDLQKKLTQTNANLGAGESPATISPEQISQMEALTGAMFDAQHAAELLHAKLDEAMRPVQDDQGAIEALQARADFLRSIGENNAAAVVDNQITALKAHLSDAIDGVIAFYRALSPEDQRKLGILDPEQLQTIIDGMVNLKAQTQEWGKIAGVSSKDVAQSFSGSLVSSFTQFLDQVASGRNVFKSLGDAARGFAASFIQSIAQMILQILAFKAAVALLRLFHIAVPGLGVGVSHTGGMAGVGTGQRRTVSPLVFAGAMRFHTGGIAGLAPDEVPIIARRDEEILTASDPRHRNNGGLSHEQAKPSGLTIVNAFDPEEAAQKILQTTVGERVLLNFITQNSRAIKSALA